MATTQGDMIAELEPTPIAIRSRQAEETDFSRSPSSDSQYLVFETCAICRADRADFSGTLR